jgi:transposase
MSNPRYPEEFKIEAVKHITERGLRVADVAERLGVSAHSLYAWVKRYRGSSQKTENKAR